MFRILGLFLKAMLFEKHSVNTSSLKQVEKL